MSAIKNIRVKGTKYAIKDPNTFSSLTSAQRTTLLADGTYLGETVATNTVFESPTGKFEQFTKEAASWAWPTPTKLTGDVASCVKASTDGTNLFAYTGTDNIVYKSTDNGSTWTEEVMPASYDTMSYSGGRYILSLGTTNFYVSGSGVLGNWQLINGPTDLGNVYAIVLKDNTFVAITTSDKIIRSSDFGETWTTVTSSYNPQNCVLANGYFVIPFKDSGRFMYSTDGINWTLNSNTIYSSRAILNCCFYLNGMYYIMIAGSGNIYSCATLDGNFTAISTPGGTSVNYHTMTYANDTYVIVSYTSAIVSYQHTTATVPTAFTVHGSVASSSAIGVSVIEHNGDVYVSTDEGIYKIALSEQTYTYSLSDLSYNKTQVDTALNAKQDTLTSGTGIDITDNTISVKDPVLQNTATGTNSLTVGGTAATGNYATNVGLGSKSVVNASAFGRNAKATASSAIALGKDSEATDNGSVAVGTSSGTANKMAVAIGYDTHASGLGCIALGSKAVNTEDQTFKVALVNSNTAAVDESTGLYTLLDSSGKVPVGRYITMVGADGTNAGTTGSVPAPSATDNTKFLRGDGTWASAGGDPSAYFLTGTTDPTETTQASFAGQIYTNTSGNKNFAFTKTSEEATFESNGAIVITDKVATGFSNTAFLSVANPFTGTGDFEAIIVFKIENDTAYDAYSCVFEAGDSTAKNFRFSLNNTNPRTILFRVIDDSSTEIVNIVGTTELSSDTKYYAKFTYSTTTGYAVSLSTDGQTWTSEGTSSVTTAMNSAGGKMYFGNNYGLGASLAFKGSLYLDEWSVTYTNGSASWTPYKTVNKWNRIDNQPSYDSTTKTITL